MIVLGLGCNVGDRLANLREALCRLRLISNLKILQVSPVYESDALLLDDAPPDWNQQFANLALGIYTTLHPEELLAAIKEVEKGMGRGIHLKWSPRLIDIDILAWDDEYYHTDKLTIPHLALTERPFALWPLADIVPAWKYCRPNCSDSGRNAEDLAKKFGSRFDGNAPLRTKQIAHRVDTPMMMGILNVTPDSFSDGGKFDDLSRALEHAKSLFAAGADIIDIGVESTRPGSKTISPEDEWSRLKPVLDSWSSLWSSKGFKPKLSVDTYKAETVQKLLSYQVDFLNEVGGLINPKMRTVVKESNAKIIFMHNLGLPANPQVILPQNVDIVSQIYRWGEKQLNSLINIGIARERLIFDVGIGFGKNAEQSLALIKGIVQFHDLDIPILVGHSRKSFLSRLTDKKFAARDLESTVFSGFLAKQKVDYLRVHDVDMNMRLLKVESLI
ncbi:MAG: dihydropteroate synthase [Coxiellaceae bacterium]|jgi:2-amino-4-hydroxy-6-hydroxymethyldihydropteridine diphosphokinase/dihydropteroate synthase|nr:dihydropteroate synthase [Coxiellaceae bacterium]